MLVRWRPVLELARRVEGPVARARPPDVELAPARPRGASSDGLRLPPPPIIARDPATLRASVGRLLAKHAASEAPANEAESRMVKLLRDLRALEEEILAKAGKEARG